MEQLLLKGILGWKRGDISENITSAIKDSDARINSATEIGKTEGKAKWRREPHSIPFCRSHQKLGKINT